MECCDLEAFFEATLTEFIFPVGKGVPLEPVQMDELMMRLDMNNDSMLVEVGGGRSGYR